MTDKLRHPFNQKMYNRKNRTIHFTIYSTRMSDAFNENMVGGRYPRIAELISEHTGNRAKFEFVDAGVALASMITMKFRSIEPTLKDIDLFVAYMD